VFTCNTDEVEEGKIEKYSLLANGQVMSYRDYIAHLCNDKEFRQYFNTRLASSAFTAYRLEAPVLNSSTLDMPFEFVLIDAPHLCLPATDAKTFASHFTDNKTIVKFKSLGADATLIAPSPDAESDHESHKHLACFVRDAGAERTDALWYAVGQVLLKNKGPLWFNTEGSGVAWLHIRLDTRPKYYGYAPYSRLNRSDRNP